MRNIIELIKYFEDGEADAFLAELYGMESVAEQRLRYRNALEKYKSLFGAAEVEIYSAPGRTEIGGNHTDHQHGKVLAASVNLDTIAVVGRNDKNAVELVSEGYNPLSVDLNDLSVDDKLYQTTTSLVKGVAAAMIEKGYKVGPFKAYVTSDVLSGSGLSSSASFETIIGVIFSGLYNEMSVSPTEIAVMGQYAENIYFGKPCGLMDQMACSVGGAVYMDFQNPAEPVVEKLEFDLERNGYCLCIVDTKGSHEDLTDDYAAVPKEMKAVAACFGKEVLREVSENEFYQNLPETRDKAGDRCVLRAIHFFEENKRVDKEVNALKSDRFEEFLKVVKASGDSSYKFLQNIYAGHDEQNQPISLALALSEQILGANGVCRVHGGGFAGTIQAFVKIEFVEKYKQEIESVFGEGACHVMRIRNVGGVKIDIFSPQNRT